MKRILGIAALCVAAYFCTSGSIAQESPDDGTLCGPLAAEPRVHECHCANMVEAVQQEYEDECHRDSKTRKQLEACLNSRPEICHTMDYPGGHRYRDRQGNIQDAADHPDQCLRKCRAHECTCNESACARPAVRGKKR